MRVAYLINRYPLTSHSFIRREIQALEAQGVEVLRFSLRSVRKAELATEADRKEHEHTRTVLSEGVTGHLLAVAGMALGRPVSFLRALASAIRLGWRSDRGLIWHVIYLAEACVLVRWLDREHVDHLHAHFGTNPAMVALLCRLLGGPVFSFTVHGPTEFDKPEFLGLREKIHSAAFTVAISSFGRSQLWRWARYEDWSKIHIIRCGLDEDLLRSPHLPISKDPRLVCVARLGAEKGHLLLVEAAARLAAEGIPFEIVLVGDGPLRQQIEELVRRYDLEKCFQIAGWMSAEQVREAIVHSRAMLLPSFAEGLPVVLMEAFALGRPVITTTIAGIPELVERGINGWLVPPGSVDALVSAMRAALVASPAELEKMGLAGSAVVAQQHDVAKEAGRLAELFRSVNRK